MPDLARPASTQAPGVLGHGLVGLQSEDEGEDGVVALELGGIVQQSLLLPFWQSPWAASGSLF